LTARVAPCPIKIGSPVVDGRRWHISHNPVFGSFSRLAATMAAQLNTGHKAVIAERRHKFADLPITEAGREII